jgi:Zn-dependent protease
MEYIFFIVVLLFSVIIHEVSHGYIADKLGDPTARLSGRLTLDPRPHIDLFGSILLPMMMILLQTGIVFGWAKPVPFDPFNLKNPRKDSAIISLAGPVSNLLIAIIASILVRFFVSSSFFYLLLAIIIQLNIVLAIFNLIPIHPLDGFKIVGGLLSEQQASEWYQLERYGMIFLLALIFIPIGNSNMLYMLINPVLNFFFSILIPNGVGAGII